ncbi:hypothetical protein MG293_008963 [Ovis ammon polii]|uniref:Coiled-coil domain containing 194 n=1 Tax=Ovis ammon polii TaxID=230172 RepID=A0AAD4U9G5_OVIAM|nr:hypothetical protein MG293_008963 [Ovis ammon polii]
MAEPGPEPEPGRAWRVFALCGAAVFLAAVAAGAALLAWNLASSASRRPRCPEPAANTTAPPGDPGPEVEELRRRLAEAARLEEALTKRLKQAERVRRELEEALRACEGRQSRLQTQLMTVKTEMEEAKAQGTQMGAENGALTEALARWEAAAAKSAQQLDEAQRRALKPWKPRRAPSAEFHTPGPAPGPDPGPAPARALAQELPGAAGDLRGAHEGESAPSWMGARDQEDRPWEPCRDTQRGAQLDEMLSRHPSTLSF